MAGQLAAIRAYECTNQGAVLCVCRKRKEERRISYCKLFKLFQKSDAGLSSPNHKNNHNSTRFLKPQGIENQMNYQHYRDISKYIAREACIIN